MDCLLFTALTQAFCHYFDPGFLSASYIDGALEENVSSLQGGFLWPVYNQLLTDVTSEIARLLELQAFRCNFNQVCVLVCVCVCV